MPSQATARAPMPLQAGARWLLLRRGARAASSAGRRIGETRRARMRFARLAFAPFEAAEDRPTAEVNEELKGGGTPAPETPPQAPETGWRPSLTRSDAARLAISFAVLLLCSWLSIALSRRSEGVATIWLPNGILFGLVIRRPRREWIAYFFAGLLADTLADVLYADPFKVAIGVSLANTVEVVLSVLILTRWFGAPLYDD